MCVKYVGYVQGALDILFVALAYVHGSVGVSTTNEQSSFVDGAVRSDLSSSPSWEGLDQALQSDGWKFDALEQIDISNLTLSKRD
jgi:hypothetical protein